MRSSDDQPLSKERKVQKMGGWPKLRGMRETHDVGRESRDRSLICRGRGGATCESGDRGHTSRKAKGRGANFGRDRPAKGGRWTVWRERTWKVLVKRRRRNSVGGGQKIVRTFYLARGGKGEGSSGGMESLPAHKRLTTQREGRNELWLVNAKLTPLQLKWRRLASAKPRGEKIRRA